jgi:hypothetical protein
VVVTPGVGFGPHGEGYVRIALCAPEERLAEAMERIVRFERSDPLRVPSLSLCLTTCGVVSRIRRYIRRG